MFDGAEIRVLEAVEDILKFFDDEILHLLLTSAIVSMGNAEPAHATTNSTDSEFTQKAE
jgi:hypothetical protein